MDKKKYYMSITSSEISQVPYGNNDNFVIYATNEEVSLLRAKLDAMDKADNQTFWRSYVPIKPYKEDKDNDEHDENLKQAYEMVYELGDETTKENLATMNILEN